MMKVDWRLFVKAGDLVRYDTVRYTDYMNQPGVVIRLWSKPPYTQGCPDREMVDVLFYYGVVADDTYEFEVIDETR